MSKRSSSSDGRSSSKRSKKDDDKYKQKYKEEKLRQRRDHAAKILAAQKQKQDRGFVVAPTNFVGTLKFRNTLPDIPFKPKLMQYPHEPQQFQKYKETKLEAEHIYELHLEPHLGLPIDLLDMEAYKAAENANLASEDQAVFDLPDETDGKVRFTKGKARPSATWLRRTAYMGNDLYDSVHAFENEISKQNKRREAIEGELERYKEFDLKDAAFQSFKDLPANDKLKHPTKKSLKPKKVWNVFPDQALYGNSYALLTYDMLPEKDIEGEDVKERQNHAILRNVEKETHRGGLSSLVGSLVIPDVKEPQDTGQKYSYFRDYQLDIKKTTEGNEFIMFLDENADDVTYCELSTRVELKKTKLGGTEARRRGAIVSRRAFTADEAENSSAKLNVVHGEFKGDTIATSAPSRDNAAAAGLTSSDEDEDKDSEEEE